MNRFLICIYRNYTFHSALILHSHYASHLCYRNEIVCVLGIKYHEYTLYIRTRKNISRKHHMLSTFLTTFACTIRMYAVKFYTCTAVEALRERIRL